MKKADILLIAVNARYTHTNPAVRGLAAVCGADWAEFHINQRPDTVLEALYNRKPRIAAFSCYIWNIGYVLALAAALREILPGVIVLLGGPEVSYDARDVLERHSFVDAVFCGEAEQAIEGVLDCLTDHAPPPDGLLVRRGGAVAGNDTYQVAEAFGSLPAPFVDAAAAPGKIYYYESSRGCPFGCAYCLSGDGVPLREKPAGRVREEVGRFVQGGARLVKFVDRTFNANSARARELLRWIAKDTGDTRFHMEVALDLFDDAALGQLAALPAGKVQLEAGIQSCNEKALEAVARKTDVARALRNAGKIMAAGNIHLHMDLIAGLPHEGPESFAESFDRVYAVGPHHLQLGFLKLLKGSRLRGEAGRYGIRFRPQPPYEALCTADMRPEDFFLLKGVAELVDRYYNTGRARGALDYITKNGFMPPFAFYKALHGYCREKGCLARPVGAADQFRILIDFCATFLDGAQYKVFLEKLKEDYCNVKIKDRMPEELARI